MLVYSAMLGCLDPVLTVAAALAHGRPVFLSTAPDMQARGEEREGQRGLWSAECGTWARGTAVAAMA